MKQRFIFLTILLLSSVQVRAQEYVTELKHWDVKDGLPYRQVNCIYQDRQGFIWVGTPYGLSRFDGYHFTNYTEVKNGPAFKGITSIAEDAKGNLWIMDRDRPNARYVFDPLTGKVTPMKDIIGKLIQTPVWDVMTMADSSILMDMDDAYNHIFYTWRADRGLHEYTIPADLSILIKMPARNCLLVENGQQELMYITLTGKVLKSVKAPFDKRQRAYLFQTSSNTYVQDTLQKKIYKISADLEINEMQVPITKQELGIPDLFSVGTNGVTWGHNKLFHEGGPIFRDFSKESLRGFEKGARCVIPDKNSATVWMGNDFGLYRLTVNKNKFRQYINDSTGSSYNNTCRGIQLWNGHLYVSNEFAGLYCIDEATHRSKHIISGYNYSLKKVADGLLTGDVYRLDEKGKLTYFKLPINVGHNCWYIYEYSQGHSLLGLNGGLLWFDERSGTFTPFTKYNGYPELAKATILFIGPDKAGHLWVCASTGLYSIDTAKGITGRYSSADTGTHYLPATEFRHFFHDAAGTFWLATTRGLIRWDKVKNTYRQYTQADGLSNNNIYAAYGDDFGNIWMSSDYGIMCFNKATGNVRTYVEEDGITNNEFNRLSHYKDDTGNIYFGSLSGLMVFNPRDFVSDSDNKKNASPVVVTSFFQFNGETNKLEDKRATLLRDNRITMYPDDRFFTLEFALLNYSNPEQTSYYWKIDGMDTGWNIQKDRVLRLSRLPYDLHLLHIKAQAADGSWSQNELRIQLNVIRPFYLRLWFLVLSLATVIVLVIGGYRWRLYLLRRENERLDRNVKEKTEDLRLSLQQKEILLKEIHHRVKNNLQVISSLLRLQSHSVKDEAAKNALLEGQNRVLSIALIHQKLYQDEKLDLVEFATFTDELFTQLRGVFGAGAEVNFTNELQETFFGIDTAVPLGLILNELITNSFKYAFKNIATPSIRLKLELNQDMYTLTYSDNGVGLPENVNIDRVHSLGLRLVTRLSKQLHGNVLYIKNDLSSFVIHFKTTTGH